MKQAGCCSSGMPVFMTDGAVLGGAVGVGESPADTAVSVMRGQESVMTQQGDAKRARQRLGGAAIASLCGLAALVIFVIQNREDIKFHFLIWDFTWRLWFYTIITALFGALVWFGLGVIRRHRRRKERREYRRS
jgi:uncharacterized integral membrane protein